MPTSGPVRRNSRLLANVVDAFESSELPFRVDVVEDWELPAAMRGRIEHERQALRIVSK